MPQPDFGFLDAIYGLGLQMLLRQSEARMAVISRGAVAMFVPTMPAHGESTKSTPRPCSIRFSGLEASVASIESVA